MPCCTCANALVLSSKLPSSAASIFLEKAASIFLEEKAFNVSGMYPANREFRAARRPGPPYSRFQRQRHVVSAAVVWREPKTLALAGDCDEFVAAAMRAIGTVFRHRTGDFVGVDAAIVGGLRKIP
jgi:hypothetical protein